MLKNWSQVVKASTAYRATLVIGIMVIASARVLCRSSRGYPLRLDSQASVTPRATATDVIRLHLNEIFTDTQASLTQSDLTTARSGEGRTRLTMGPAL